MAVGDIHTLENDNMRVILTEHATYGFVLTSIENLEDGAEMTFAAQSPFRVILRKVQQADSFFTLDASNKTTVTIHGTEEYLGGGGPGNLLVGESPARGARKFFHADFHYENVNGTSDDLMIHVYINLLDNEPERVLFSLILDQTDNTGILTMSSHGFFWAAPILIATAPFTTDHYIIGTNAGTVTRDPKNDLVGNGSTYRFHVGTDFSSVTKTLDAATGFEPEAQPSRYADRMEVMYPTWLSIALSGYGNRATEGSTIYLHDELRFRNRRVLDTYSGGTIKLEHEVLVDNGITNANGWGDVVQYRADTYVGLFKRIGDVLGEDVGLHYRRWARSSPNGLAVVPAKAKDKTDNGQEIQRSPIFRPYFPEDDDYDNGITERIAEEFRMAFPALADITLHPLYRTNYDLVYEYNNDASGTLPGNVGNTSADLFAISADAIKKTYSQELNDDYGLWTYAGIVPRRPTPFDGRGYFVTDGMSAARVRNHHDALDGSYKTVDQVLKYSKTVNAVTFSGGFTKITLSAGAFDPDLWTIFSNHTTTTGGIDHSTHVAHLGWFQKTDVAYAFPIEKQVAGEANFKADPPIIWVAGDRTATILVGHALDVHFVQAQYLPGYPVASGLPAGTSLCGMADTIGNQGGTVGGWATRFIADFIAQCRPWMSGALHVLTRVDQICWHTHGNETPGSNQQLLAWRRILAALRSQVLAAHNTEFQIWDEDGPYDWLLGLIDGHTRTSIRLDLTSLVRQWGASPLFQTVWGDFYRFGGQLGDRNGHITNYLGRSVYDTEFIGTPSKKWREAMAGDFMYGRLPSFGVYPAEDGNLGTRPDGATAYTPFYHETEGMTVSGSYAAMMARLAQMQLFFDSVNVFGRRVRSFTRSSTRVVPHVPVSTGFGHGEVYNIGIDESGPNRAPFCHNVMRDHRNPRRLVATFINPDITATGTSYVIDPDLYASEIPLITPGYKLKLYRCNYDGVELEREWMAQGQERFALHLEAGQVMVLTVEFAELQFIYRYDDEDFVEVDIPIDQTRHRVEPLGGQGARFQFGFKSDYSESDFRIASAQLRAFLMGRSENV